MKPILILGILLCSWVCAQNGQDFDVDRIFRRFDRNNDQKLEKNEIPPMIWKKLSNADFNQDGFVSRQELQQVKMRLEKMAQHDKSDDVKKERTVTSPFDNPKNWSAFDAGETDGLDTKGYFGTVSDGRYIYFVPCRSRDFHARVLRYDTRGEFKEPSSWASYDAGHTGGMKSIGYAGGVYDGRYVYFVPMVEGGGKRHAVVLRYDTQGEFKSSRSWSVRDMKKIGGIDATGFVEAILKGKSIYFVPFGYPPYAHGHVTRYSIEGDFHSDAAWSRYDASRTQGLVTQGFYGGVCDERYVYFVPFNDGKQFHGRVLRYDTTRDFQSPESWSAYDAGKTEGMTSVGYKARCSTDDTFTSSLFRMEKAFMPGS